MRLNELFPNVPSIPVESICTDSRQATPNSMFVCLQGFTTDGHQYAKSAYQSGCRIFLVQKPLELPKDACVIRVEDTHTELIRVSDIFYDHPSRQLHIIAITGTKGKTTSALMAYHILNSCGIATGYIGTVGIYCADKKLPTVNTTPDCLVLNQVMRDMIDQGISILVMEVSSQAEKVGRIMGLSWEVVALTNLYTDHIGPGEHPDLQDYWACKRQILTRHGSPVLLCNADQEETIQMTEGLPNRTLFGQSPKAQSRALNPHRFQENRTIGVSFDWQGQSYKIPVPGLFNVQNALLALLIGQHCGLTPSQMVKPLSTYITEGRMEIYPYTSEYTILIDYAHNSVSLEAALQTLREYHPKRLLCLFGCVGGRTQIRRYKMGQIAGQLADYCILTSDNPDFEDPQNILNEMSQALESVPKHCDYTCIVDRAEAIQYATSLLQKGDILLLAGKGHENYQLLQGRHVPFSEKMILDSIYRK